MESRWIEVVRQDRRWGNLSDCGLEHFRCGEDAWEVLLVLNNCLAFVLSLAEEAALDMTAGKCCFRHQKVFFFEREKVKGLLLNAVSSCWWIWVSIHLRTYELSSWPLTFGTG